MQPRRVPISSLWMMLGWLLAAFGGIPLLAGHFAATTPGRAAAKLGVGALILVYAFWLRRRERKAIDQGTMLPNEEL